MRHSILGLKTLIPFFIRSNNRKKALQEFSQLHSMYGDILQINWPMKVFLINHPVLFKHIFKDKSSRYQKSKLYRKLEFIFGRGLLSSEGEQWRKSRSELAPHFSQLSLDRHTQEAGHISFEHWENQKEKIDFNAVTSFMALQVIDRCFMGGGLEGKLIHIQNTLPKLLDEINRRVRNPLREKIPWLFPHSHSTKKNIAILDNLFQDLMQTASPDSPFGKIIENKKLSLEQIRSEALTLFMAGHETTSNALSWSVYFLAKHKEYIPLLREERKMIGGPLEKINPQNVYSLPMTKAVILESMRLLPPIPSISRVCVEDDVIHGVVIPKGSIIGIHQYIIHRDPRFWKRPELFYPERFLADERPQEYTYFPFGEGKRACIGERLAMVEMIIFLSDFVCRYDFELDSSFRFRPIFKMTLFNDGGMPLKLKKILQ